VLTPAGEPGGGRGVQYGLDAVRLPVRMAEDCDERGKFLAAAMWPFLESEWKKGRIVATYGLDGRPSAGYEHPASIVGAAGAATAAGDERTAARLLDHAEALERKSPSYYGAAWVALGRAMLTTDLLGGC
jgi:endoglucanase